MKILTWVYLAIFAISLWLLPATGFAHHMGSGNAPDVVDDYAHGANAQAENETGYNVNSMSDDDIGGYTGEEGNADDDAGNDDQDTGNDDENGGNDDEDTGGGDSEE